ncbi:MAG: MFS transporter, partial [Cryobacterium sp.]|nr:MFS transporter [Cryobacterium sp.]
MRFAPIRRGGENTGVSRPRLSREVYVLGVIAFFVMVGFGVVVPVLPVYVRSFGVGYLEIGAVVSAFALMRFVSSPFTGRMIDWAGERVILASGIGIVAVSSGLVGVAQNYPQLLLLRGAGGVGSAMFSVAAMTLLLGSTAPGIRARAIGFYQGGFLLGGMAGPALGGLLATISLTAPFFFYAATLAVAGVLGLVLLRPVRGGAVATAGPPPERIPFRTVLRDTR